MKNHRTSSEILEFRSAIPSLFSEIILVIIIITMTIIDRNHVGSDLCRPFALGQRLSFRGHTSWHEDLVHEVHPALIRRNRLQMDARRVHGHQRPDHNGTPSVIINDDSSSTMMYCRHPF